MRLKSFHGPNLTEAMKLVRDTLGDNAIIVATRDDDMGGIRVTAAIDDAPHTTKHPEPNPSSIDTGSEIIELIATALVQHQVLPDLAEKLLASATQFASEDPLLSLGAAFDTHFTYAPILTHEAKKPLVFIGPVGAGKTLSVAKFATKATLAKEKISVISADTERAGGIEQLAAFTRLLNLSLMEIEDSHALREVVGIHGGSEGALLIDTPGRNPFNETEKRGIKDFVTAAGGEAILVLPSDMDGSEAIDMANEFRAVGASRLLITRLDTTRRMGTLLRLAYETRLPLANFSASPKVTEVPQPFNPVSLARLILPKEKKPLKATGTNA